jgi:hypothetical protein
VFLNRFNILIKKIKKIIFIHHLLASKHFLIVLLRIENNSKSRLIQAGKWFDKKLKKNHLE